MEILQHIARFKTRQRHFVFLILLTLLARRHRQRFRHIHIFNAAVRLDDTGAESRLHRYQRMVAHLLLHRGIDGKFAEIFHSCRIIEFHHYAFHIHRIHGIVVSHAYGR